MLCIMDFVFMGLQLLAMLSLVYLVKTTNNACQSKCSLKSQASGNKRHSSYICSHFKIIVKAGKDYITTSGGKLLKGLQLQQEA